MFMVGNEIKGDWSLDSWSLSIFNIILIKIISVYLHTLSFSCRVLLQFKLALSSQIGVCKLGQRSSHLLMVKDIIIIMQISRYHLGMGSASMVFVTIFSFS